MISEYNLRQITIMQERIKQYRKGEIRIDQLINNLEALVNCLEKIDEDWKNSFLFAWSILEIVYASALYNKKVSLDENDIYEISRGLKKIDALINVLIPRIGNA